MEILNTEFNLKPINNFISIKIFHDKNGYFIGYVFDGKLGQTTILEFVDFMFGGFYYLNNSEILKPKYFQSYDEAIETIKKQTIKNINQLIFENEHQRYLAIQKT